MHSFPSHASIVRFIIGLLLLCLAREANAQGGGIRVGPAINIEPDFRKEVGLMLGVDYFWVVRQWWHFGLGLKYIGFGPDTKRMPNISGGGSMQWSLMNFLRLRGNDELDDMSFITTFGLGPTIMIQPDVMTTNGAQTQTLHLKNVFALTGSIGSGIDWPIVDENLALTAEFEAMINFFVEDKYQLPAFYFSFGVEYRVAPW